MVLATGQRGDPRKLGIPGEDREPVYPLYSPRQYKSENIQIVGGGNAAAEAAITLSEHNQVCPSYRLVVDVWLVGIPRVSVYARF